MMIVRLRLTFLEKKKEEEEEEAEKKTRKSTPTVTQPF
jgi:hypothetical protein